MVRITFHSVTFRILTHRRRAARMSIVFSIIRVTNHSNFKVHRRITYLIAVSFACMWVALLAHRLTLCAYHSCRMDKSVAFSVLISQYLCALARCQRHDMDLKLHLGLQQTSLRILFLSLHRWGSGEILGFRGAQRYWFCPPSAHQF